MPLENKLAEGRQGAEKSVAMDVWCYKRGPNKELEGNESGRNIQQKVQERRLKWYGHGRERDYECVTKGDEDGFGSEENERKTEEEEEVDEQCKCGLGEEGCSTEETLNRVMWRQLVRNTDST